MAPVWVAGATGGCFGHKATAPAQRSTFLHLTDEWNQGVLVFLYLPYITYNVIRFHLCCAMTKFSLIWDVFKDSWKLPIKKVCVNSQFCQQKHLLCIFCRLFEVSAHSHCASMSRFLCPCIGRWVVGWPISGRLWILSAAVIIAVLFVMWISSALHAHS